MNNKKEMMILAIVCFLLTIAISIQIKTVTKNGTTNSINRTESSLRDQVLKMKEKYENIYQELERNQKELERVRKEVSSNNNELKELENKIKKYNMLLGNTDVKGQGVKITLNDGTILVSDFFDENKERDLIVHAINVLDIVNELRNAGAEAISINGERIVNTTAIPCDGNVIIVNGKKIGTPIEISAIGLSEMLSTLNRPGGTLEHLKRLGKEVEFKKYSNIEIPKYTGVYSFKYAKIIK